MMPGERIIMWKCLPCQCYRSLLHQPCTGTFSVFVQERSECFRASSVYALMLVQINMRGTWCAIKIWQRHCRYTFA